MNKYHIVNDTNFIKLLRIWAFFKNNSNFFEIKLNWDTLSVTQLRQNILLQQGVSIVIDQVILKVVKNINFPFKTTKQNNLLYFLLQILNTECQQRLKMICYYELSYQLFAIDNFSNQQAHSFHNLSIDRRYDFLIFLVDSVENDTRYKEYMEKRQTEINENKENKNISLQDISILGIVGNQCYLYLKQIVGCVFCQKEGKWDLIEGKDNIIKLIQQILQKKNIQDEQLVLVSNLDKIVRQIQTEKQQQSPLFKNQLKPRLAATHDKFNILKEIIIEWQFLLCNYIAQHLAGRILKKNQRLIWIENQLIHMVYQITKTKSNFMRIPKHYGVMYDARLSTDDYHDEIFSVNSWAPQLFSLKKGSYCFTLTKSIKQLQDTNTIYFPQQYFMVSLLAQITNLAYNSIKQTKLKMPKLTDIQRIIKDIKETTNKQSYKQISQNKIKCTRLKPLKRQLSEDLGDSYQSSLSENNGDTNSNFEPPDRYVLRVRRIQKPNLQRKQTRMKNHKKMNLSQDSESQSFCESFQVYKYNNEKKQLINTWNFK